MAPDCRRTGWSRRVATAGWGWRRASWDACGRWAARRASRRRPDRARRSSFVSDADAPLRVLVVDDHPIWRDAVARDLEAAGFDVCGVAQDGERAVRIATATRP